MRSQISPTKPRTQISITSFSSRAGPMACWRFINLLVHLPRSGKKARPRSYCSYITHHVSLPPTAHKDMRRNSPEWLVGGAIESGLGPSDRSSRCPSSIIRSRMFKCRKGDTRGCEEEEKWRSSLYACAMTRLLAGSTPNPI